MIQKFFLHLLFYGLSISSAFSQNNLMRWDSLFRASKIIIRPLNELNSPKDDYAPLMLPSGNILFTSERTNPKTREYSVANNQNIYESSDKHNKPRYSYFYNSDDHSAIAGCSADGSSVFIYRAFFGGSLYYTGGLNGKQRYRHFKAFGMPLNNDESQEQSVAQWTKWLVISSDRPSSNGSFELYSGMADENMKVSDLRLLEKINSDSAETDVRFMSDGTMLFSSNRNGKYSPFSARFDGSNWETPTQVTIIPDSFSNSDVRDLVVYDTVFFFSSNRSGNYEIYSASIIKDSVPIVTPDTIVLTVIEDSVPMTIDTAVAQIPQNEFDQKLEDLERKLDSLEFKPYRAFVQVGAYRFVTTVADFKTRFPSFDTTALRIEFETIEDNPSDKLQRYIIDQTYLTLRAAAMRQQIALQQQASPTNLYESPVDAFIAVYDNRNVRIVIFFNLEKKDFKILVGETVVYF